jgi:hypothetical protein
MMKPVVIVCSLVLGGALQAPHAHAQPSDDNAPLLSVAQEAQQLDTKAREAYYANELEQARGWWIQSYALYPTANVALSLGRVELSLKRYRDSAEHLDYALRHMPDSKSEKAHSEAQKALADARAHVAAVEVTTTQLNVELRVDGKKVGRSPLDHVIYLDAGTHELSAHLGSNSIARAVTVQPPQVYQVNLPLVVQTRAVETRRAEPVVVANESARRSDEKDEAPAADARRDPVPIVIGGTLFMAGIASGIVFRLNSDTKFDNAEQMRARRANTGCVGDQVQSTECQALLSAAESGDRARNWSTAGFVVAGAALAGTLTYWFWPRHSERPQKAAQLRVHVTPSLTDKSSGMLLAGEF